MCIVLLRRLTKKSKLQFGKHKHMTVNDLLSVNKHSVLIGIYYGLGNITFSDDVLEELLILEEDRIKKPGSDKEKIVPMQQKWWAKFNENRTKEERIKDWSVMMANRRRSAKAKAKIPARGALQGYNHGHLSHI